jgi:hypothetical protein
MVLQGAVRADARRSQHHPRRSRTVRHLRRKRVGVEIETLLEVSSKDPYLQLKGPLLAILLPGAGSRGCYPWPISTPSWANQNTRWSTALFPVVDRALCVEPARVRLHSELIRRRLDRRRVVLSDRRKPESDLRNDADPHRELPACALGRVCRRADRRSRDPRYRSIFADTPDRDHHLAPVCRQPRARLSCRVW